MSDWAKGLRVGSVAYSVSKGSISIKTDKDEWHESMIGEGWIVDDDDMNSAYKESDVVVAVDLVTGAEVGTVLVSDYGAYYKMGDDEWTATGTPGTYKDETVRGMRGLREV